ncbi:glycosyltransferase family 9 protein [Dyadobacter sp. CY345]|uniref:glycosyltransferase family 9 protein n=1 Tax=Dyadobacter sp. CY345 TaxID=2909335 RepID=UPI001F2443B8|nr:glycosyltransferase family 9 protein [Dyadobacter sp. CY345]MCF2446700.1 glycosyltransferase family 9 protein [Dyadobacter sp. CY345]
MRENSDYQNVLCVRPDNMGDVIMSSPAIRALKETFGSRITLLTSAAGAVIVPYLDCIDDVIIADLPWVGTGGLSDSGLLNLTEIIKAGNFHAAIIFTVYSQNALPTAMLLYMAGIPVRVAYARENPYDLLTHWVPDKEPYECILHQVQRDLNLVANLGAGTDDDHLIINMQFSCEHLFYQKLYDLLPDAPGTSYFVLHPCVSEAKREYPVSYWIEVGKMIIREYNMPVLISGSAKEIALAETITEGIGAQATCVAGAFSIGEFICLINQAHGVVSVNTGTIHIAAARQTPIVVLYAQTNPQHTPWKSEQSILPFSVPEHLQSRNAIICHVASKYYSETVPFPEPTLVLDALGKLVGVGCNNVFGNLEE